MRDFSAFSSGGLGDANFKITVHRYRIAVDDFTVEVAGNRERQRSLPACGRAEHRDQQRFTRQQR
jgi:hypothetical protein